MGRQSTEGFSTMMIEFGVLFLLALPAHGCWSRSEPGRRPNQPLVPEDLVCPSSPTTCAQSDLHSRWNGQYDYKLCNFICPNVASLNPNDPNSGYVCHDTNHQTRQYEWCCKSPGKTIPVCTEVEGGPPLDLDDPIPTRSYG